jgi:hypothetical protein
MKTTWREASAILAFLADTPERIRKVDESASCRGQGTNCQTELSPNYELSFKCLLLQA